MTAMRKEKKNKSEELDRIKKNIEASYLYFKPNYDRYHRFRNFVFNTSLNAQDIQVLDITKKPKVEFNILEAFLSRLLGEFVKHEPSIEASPAESSPVDVATMEFVMGHFRHIMYEANKDSMSYEVYKDLLSGGFSAVKVYTDYPTPMSMHQVIKLARVFDPTLTGFDPMARFSHKGDGRYAYEIFPRSKEDFEREFPGVNIDSLRYSRNVASFNWSYENAKEPIIVLAEYFEKKKKKAKIVKLSTGRVILEKDYERFVEDWNKENWGQAPIVIGKPRVTELETICRYRLIESEILDYKESDYPALPLVFVDGNSIKLRESEGNDVRQMTRPYVYHAEGIQRLKNFAGQTLANELENMIQHKFIVAEESLPQSEEYLAAYNNVQQANTLVYQAYNENLPDQAVPPPREVTRTPIPQEVMQAYSVTDSTSQVILGTFDSALGINDNQLSGVAIIEGATQSNSAAMPFTAGYLQAFTHIGCMVANLIPLYHVTPRTLPVIGIDGKRTYQKVNQPNKQGPQLDYEQSALNIYVEAGVNFQIAKNQALQQLIMLMKASPRFEAFVNDNLEVLVDNLTIYGADVLKQMVPQWETKQKQMQAQQQQAMMNDPRYIMAQAKASEIQSKTQLDQAKFAQEQKQQGFDNHITVAKVHLDKQKVDQTGQLGAAKIQQDQVESTVQVIKSQAEIDRAQIDSAAEVAEKAHSAALERESLMHNKKMDHHESIRESVRLQHEMKQAEKESDRLEKESSNQSKGEANE